MPISLKGRSLLTLRDFSADEIALMVDTAADLKAARRAGIFPRRLAHKNLALIFLKPSARTRASFAVAAADEGANLEVLPPADIRFGEKESVKDIARVLGRLFDGIVFRGFQHALVRELAQHAGIPVWNALCDTYHPTQVLADLLTLRENVGHIRGTKLCYVGDGRNNVVTSLMVGAAKMGVAGLSKCIALDMQRFNVTSNAVAPFAWTRMVATIPETPENKRRLEVNRRLKPEKIAPLVVALASDAGKKTNGQVFGVRNNEIYLFSQPRPIRTAHTAEGWTPETVVDRVLNAFQPSYYPLDRSSDVFTWDPV